MTRHWQREGGCSREGKARQRALCTALVRGSAQRGRTATCQGPVHVLDASDLRDPVSATGRWGGVPAGTSDSTAKLEQGKPPPGTAALVTI